jgi:hypothetical protein
VDELIEDLDEEPATLVSQQLSGKQRVRLAHVLLERGDGLAHVGERDALLTTQHSEHMKLDEVLERQHSNVDLESGAQA